jgi:hemoglobin
MKQDIWIICMTKAFDECQVAEPLRSELLHSLLKLADHMRNQQEPAN